MRSRSQDGPVRHSTLIAGVAGIVLCFAFPPYGIWPLAPLAVALLCLATNGHSAWAGSWRGLIAGVAFFLPLLHWSSTYVGALPWLLLTLCQAVFFVALGAGLAIVQRVPAWPLWAAAVWVAEEAARDRIPFGGFPWGRLAFSQPEGAFTPYVAVAGAPALTFVVALTGCLLAYAVRARLTRLGWFPALAALFGVAAVPLVGVSLWLTISTGNNDSKVNVALIQGNVPRLGLSFNAQREAVLRDHVQETISLANKVKKGIAPQPDVVIWPENASDIDPLHNADAYAEIDQAVRAINAPVLVGAILDGPGNKARNAGIVWSPTTGPGQMYVKQHLVPFGEYVPLRLIARAVTDKVDLVRRELSAGHTPGVLHVGKLTLGDVICFEVADDGIVRDAVNGGGQVLVVQTNNATFGRSAETYQQLAMGRVRAVEFGRTTLVAATSGISAIIKPDGQVVQQSKIFTPDALSMAVPVRDTRTLAARVGAWPEWTITAIGLLAVIAGMRVRRQRRLAVVDLGQRESARPALTREGV